MSCYLKINIEHGQANNPKLIFSGKCVGSIQIVNQDLLPLESSYTGKNLAKKNRTGRIFICESTSMIHLQLLPYACGFIFREGTNLSHFANILRQHHICSCIDEELWHWAVHAADKIEENIIAEFVCDYRDDYSEQIKKSYKIHLDAYFDKLEKKPILLPVYDIEKNVFMYQDNIFPAALGAKALSVNALKNDELPVPKTFILTGIPENSKPQFQTDSVIKAVHNIFPELGNTNMEYMLRASIYAASNSKTIVSGRIKTSSFRTYQEFKNLYTQYINTWNAICTTTPGMNLSIIIQERIPACIFGVVFTRLPWDYLSNEMIFDLSLHDIRVNDSGKVQVIIKDCNGSTGNTRKKDIYNQLVTRLAPELPSQFNKNDLYESMSAFLDNCIELQKNYMVPLDIEFAMNKEFKIYYTQFRHIHFM